MADFPLGNGPFDFSSMSQLLNDPSIKEMAEQIAQNPAFAQMTQALQSAMGPLEEGAPPATNSMDPAEYAKAMSGILENQDFMKMAETLGRRIMEQDPTMASAMNAFQNPSTRAAMEERMKVIKEDPELAPILKEIEEAGPGALMKYWESPEVMQKFGKAMEGAFESAGDEEEEEEEEGEDADDLHTHASTGNVKRIRELLKEGHDKDATDEEGRTPLHFASGYGEIECVTELLDAGANIDAVDNNQNTPLHYAAGYGQPELVKLLIEREAKKDVKNADEKTPAEVAELNAHADVVAILKD